MPAYAGMTTRSLRDGTQQRTRSYLAGAPRGNEGLPSDLIRGMREAPEGRDPARAQGVLMGAPRATIFRPMPRRFTSVSAAPRRGFVSTEAAGVDLACFRPGGCELGPLRLVR